MHFSLINLTHGKGRSIPLEVRAKTELCLTTQGSDSSLADHLSLRLAFKHSNTCKGIEVHPTPHQATPSHTTFDIHLKSWPPQHEHSKRGRAKEENFQVYHAIHRRMEKLHTYRSAFSLRSPTADQPTSTNFLLPLILET